MDHRRGKFEVGESAHNFEKLTRSQWTETAERNLAPLIPGKMGHMYDSFSWGTNHFGAENRFVQPYK